MHYAENESLTEHSNLAFLLKNLLTVLSRNGIGFQKRNLRNGNVFSKARNAEKRNKSRNENIKKKSRNDDYLLNNRIFNKKLIFRIPSFLEFLRLFGKVHQKKNEGVIIQFYHKHFKNIYSWDYVNNVEFSSNILAKSTKIDSYDCKGT